jgi:hypothetical protein
MKLVDQNNKKALIPRTGIENGSESGLQYPKIRRDSGIAIYSTKLVILRYKDKKKSHISYLLFRLLGYWQNSKKHAPYFRDVRNFVFIFCKNFMAYRS